MTESFIFYTNERKNMDILLNVAEKFATIMNKKYYFEIAKKNNLMEFVLTFEKYDFYHLAGLHKLTDIAELQNEFNKGKIFNSILDGNITYDLINCSRFFNKISNRLNLLGDLEYILDSNQLLFKYLEEKNKISRIEADYLLENAHNMNVIYIFLSERNKNEISNLPIMCCRSFFAMDKLDYSKNQPSYTLLKKIKVNTFSGEKIVQYDRKNILEKAKAATTETERKSIMQQLNENKARLAINDVMQGKIIVDKSKRNIEKI